MCYYQVVEHRPGSEVIAAQVVLASYPTVSGDLEGLLGMVQYSRIFCLLGDDFWWVPLAGLCGPNL